MHVRIARHRPESNGIAERFVRTLKEWLAERAWGGVEALQALLEPFRAAYNDRPHQGLAFRASHRTSLPPGSGSCRISTSVQHVSAPNTATAY